MANTIVNHYEFNCTVDGPVSKWDEEGNTVTCPIDASHELVAGSIRVVGRKGAEPIINEFGSLEVAPVKGVPIGTTFKFHTHNFADKTTWYQPSLPIVGEVLTNPTTDLKTYQSAHYPVIDIYSLTLTARENYILKADGSFGKRSDWADIIYVNDEPVLDGYTIDFSTGTIVFDSELLGTDVVKMSYHYVNPVGGSVYKVVPTSDHNIIIEGSKIIFSKDTVIPTAVCFDIFAGMESRQYPLYNDLTPYNQFAFRYRSRADFYNNCDFIEHSCPAGEFLTQDLAACSFKYDYVIMLRDAPEYSELHIGLFNDEPCTSSELASGQVTVTFASVSIDD